MTSAPKIITSDHVHTLLNQDELMVAIEKAFGNFSLKDGGGVVQPIRSVVPVDRHHGYLFVMPAYSSMEDALATKLVSFYPVNPTGPRDREWILYFNAADGCLKAIIDGESITAMRTAMASVVATKRLANPNAKILAILGSGVEARSHFKALTRLQEFDEVRVWSRTPAHAKKFAHDIKAKCCDNVQDCVKDADIICTVTFATTPLLKAEWVKPGAHINAVGACRPEWQELDPQLMRSAKVYVDSLDAVNKESGDVIISGCEVFGEIGEVINGEKEALYQETTIFKSVGIAVEDVVAAKLIYEKYEKTMLVQ